MTIKSIDDVDMFNLIVQPKITEPAIPQFKVNDRNTVCISAIAMKEMMFVRMDKQNYSMPTRDVSEKQNQIDG